jgi:hypothetical protein
VIKLIGLLVIVWLVIGAVAAGQRHYYSGSATSCAKDSTTAVTIVAGPLNHCGRAPKSPLHRAEAQQVAVHRERKPRRPEGYVTNRGSEASRKASCCRADEGSVVVQNWNVEVG